MAELERCLAEGAVMLKCLPNCQNIDWNDRRYTAFLERMAAAGLPLLAHTGSERTMPVLAPHLGAQTVDAQVAVSVEVARQIVEFFAASRR